METANIVINQVGVLFILVLAGFILVKTNIVRESANKDLSNILLYAVVPCTLIKAYNREIIYSEVISLLGSFGLSIFFHILGIIISILFVRKTENDDYKIDRLAVVYSNCGFMAFPIITAVLGEDGIFYASAFVAVFNILIWTHGLIVLKGKKSLNIKKAVLNPGCIAVMLGLITYIFQINYHPVIYSAVNFMAELNTPLAMIVIGGMLASVKWDKFLDFKMLAACFLRNVAVPLTGILIIKILGIYSFSETITNVCITAALCAACPTAASVSLVPASLGINASRGAKIIAFSTICSVITLPLTAFLISKIF